MTTPTSPEGDWWAWERQMRDHLDLIARETAAARAQAERDMKGPPPWGGLFE